MAQVTIPWNSGTGNIVLTFTGQGNATVIVSSDDNSLDTERSQAITVKTLDGSIQRRVTITQAAGPNFKTKDGERVKLKDGNYLNIRID